MSRYQFIFPALIISVSIISACSTTDKKVEQLVHQRKAPAKTNPHKSEFIREVQGDYIMHDDTVFTIDSEGKFTLGETEYILHDAISSQQGIYIGVTPVPDSKKKVYTYHGIALTSFELLAIPFRAPEKSQDLLTEKDTEYSWEVNTFQVENINWKSGFMTTIATRLNHPID